MAPPLVATMTFCHCMLPIGQPHRTVRWYWADQSPEPAEVTAVVRWGDEPELRRWEQRERNTWIQAGSMVDFYTEITPPSRWSQLGTCYWGNRHPIIPVELAGDQWRYLN